MSVLSDDDWLDELEKLKKIVVYLLLLVLMNKKVLMKLKFLDWNDASELTVKVSTYIEFRLFDIFGAKVGKMFEVVVVKYLLKVKGYNEKMYEKFRCLILKLGVEEEVNDAYDVIDEDSEEDGYNIRYENVVKVVEVVEM